MTRHAHDPRRPRVRGNLPNGPAIPQGSKPAVLCDRCGAWPALHRDLDIHPLCETCWEQLP